MIAKANILIVDDEPVARQSLTDILRLDGYQVAAVANGEAAIDHVRTKMVDLIILDLRMVGMGGLDVVKVINQVSPDVEIILLTAYGSMESAIEALRHRVHDYLLKPASPQQILESVARGIARQKERKAAMSAGGYLDTQQIVKLVGDIVVDLARRIIRHGDRTITLTPAEGRLLKVFLENQGKVFAHRELVLLVQGYSTSQQEAPEILRPLISRLRQKLASVKPLADRIVSVRGTGYVFEETK